MKNKKIIPMALSAILMTSTAIPTATAFAASSKELTAKELASCERKLDDHKYVLKERFWANTSSTVMALQKLLIDCNYPVEVDGIFGSETKTAVKKFQKCYGLTVDGIAGQATIDKLVEVAADMPKATSKTTSTSKKESKTEKFEKKVYAVAHKQVGETYSKYADTNIPWCGWYVCYVLKTAYEEMGLKAKKYIPVSSLPGACRTSEAFQSGDYGPYYCFTNWEYEGYSASKSSNRKNYKPQVGDIWLVETNNIDDGPDHLALVIKVTNSHVLTSEGNTGAGNISTRTVKEHQYHYKNGYWRRANASDCIVHMACRPATIG